MEFKLFLPFSILPEEDWCYEPIQLLNSSSKHSSVKILGIQWNPGSDVIFLNVKGARITIKYTITIKYIYQIYDPLGLAALTTVLLKLIFQESWT